MEESKELQGFYKIFRSVIYISILMEFFEYAIDPAMLDHWGGILCDIHGRIKRWVIYNDGNLAYSKLATFLLICITCQNIFDGIISRKNILVKTGFQWPQASPLSYHSRYRADCTVRMAVRLSDGNKALFLAPEHLALYDCLRGRRDTGSHRP